MTACTYRAWLHICIVINGMLRTLCGKSPGKRAKLWRKHPLSYGQSKHVVEQTRRELWLEAPRERRRTAERLDRTEVERLIEAVYVRSSRYGFMVKILFDTGALDPPQVYTSPKPRATATFPFRQPWRRNYARTLAAGGMGVSSRATAPRISSRRLISPHQPASPAPHRANPADTAWDGQTRRQATPGPRNPCPNRPGPPHRRR